MGAVVGFGARMKVRDLMVGSPPIACDLQHKYLPSFRTREREEDSNATPPMTISRVEEGCVVFVAGAGTWLDAIF